MGQNERRAWIFFSTEWLNLGVVSLNFWATNQFLKGEFAWYGWEVLNFLRMNVTEQAKTYNPMCYSFPTVVSLLPVNILTYFYFFSKVWFLTSGFLPFRKAWSRDWPRLHVRPGTKHHQWEDLSGFLVVVSGAVCSSHIWGCDQNVLPGLGTVQNK